MTAIKIPKEDRYIFLEVARRLQLDFTRLNKICDPRLEYFHADKFNLSQNDLFQLGILFHQLKTSKAFNYDH